MIKLKDILNESPADDDMAAAVKMKGDLEEVIEEIGEAVNDINKKLSSFNSPGLRVAFLSEISKGILRQGQKFDERNALRTLNDYYNR